MTLLGNITTFHYLYIAKGNKMYSVFHFLIRSMFRLVTVKFPNMSLNLIKKFTCNININGMIYCVVHKMLGTVEK